MPKGIYVILGKNVKTKSMNTKNYAGGKKIFLTGLNGFIASALAERLVDAGYEVSGLVRQSSRPSPDLENLRGKVDIYNGDLSDFSGLRKILETASPAYLIHMGAITPVSYSFLNPIEVNRNNYIGSLNIVEAARESLPHLKGFFFSSSMEVFGEQPDDLQVFDEKTEPHPLAPYAVSKRAFEIYLDLLWRVYKFPCFSVRQTNCYGRKTSSYFIVETIVTQMLKSKVINLGRKDPVRNLIHIDDLCNFYLTAIETLEMGKVDPKKIFGQIFCTGPNNGITIEELVDRIAGLMKWKGKINWGTREIRAGEVFRLNSKPNKAIETFGWKPQIGLDEGLKRTIAYWRKKLS